MKYAGVTGAATEPWPNSKPKIARYLYGLEYNQSDVKFALMEASEGRVGSPVDKIILSCFHYDATLGEYGPFAMGIMRLGGAGMILIVGIPLIFVWRRERRQRVSKLVEVRRESDELEARA